MKHLGKATLLLLLLCLAGGVALAQGTPVINRWIIGGGGGTATGGNVSLSSALGQALAGPSSGGNVSISVGFWTGGVASVDREVYLPMIVKNFINYAPPCGPGNDYCEDYDTRGQAYGPLESGTGYSAYPDDSNDYYYVILTESTSITVQVTGYQTEGQLMVYDEDEITLGRDWNNAGGDGVMTVGPLDLGAGRYYIRVYTSVTNATSLYTLTTTY